MTDKAEYIEKEAFIKHIRNIANGLHERMPIDIVLEAVINEVKAFPCANLSRKEEAE